MALIIRNPSLDIHNIEKYDIKKVILDQCALTESDMDALEQALIRTASVEVLYLSRNDINFGSRCLARALAVNKTIKKLHLCCQPGINSILGKSIEQNHTITELYLLNNGSTLISNGAIELAKNISMNKHLMKLVLPQNGFSAHEGEMFIKVANNHISIKEIDLSFNQINSNICDVLSEINNLSVVSLAGNPLKNGSRIAEALAQNPKIRELDLSCCKISNLACLASSFKTNTHLESLNIARNGSTNEKAFCGFSQECDESIRTVNTISIIEHYLQWNRSGRYLLQTSDRKTPEGLWSLVLEKVAKQPALLYEYVKANPHWAIQKSYEH